MCFYASTLYACGDWKWGNMKLRCPKQHRIGEVCGRKFFDHENTTRVNEECRLCQDIKVKVGRLEKEQNNIRRWREEGNRFKSSIEKAMEQSQELAEIIRDMDSRRMKKQYAISSKQGGDTGGAGGGRHGHSAGGYREAGDEASYDRYSTSQHGHRHGGDRHGSGGRHGCSAGTEKT